MGEPTIRKQPTNRLPPKKPDPRHLELWQKHQNGQRAGKAVRVPGKR